MEEGSKHPVGDTAEKEVKGKSDDIELRSEKVRNIVGQIPPLLIRSGIGIIVAVVVLALTVCYFIPYYETTDGNIQLYSFPAAETFTSPTEGTVHISLVFSNDGAPVSKGDTLGYIAPFDSDDTQIGLSGLSDGERDNGGGQRNVGSVVWLTAGTTGKFSVNVISGERISKGERLFAVTPDSITAVYGRIMLLSSMKMKIKEGQPVKIEPDGFPSREYGIVQGIVGRIYPLPVDDGNGSMTLKADVSLPARLTTSYRKELPFTPEMRGNAKVILSKQSLLKKLLFNENK